MVKARVLLADDHLMVAEGLRRMLEPEFDLVGIVQDGRALVESAERLQPDIILADITMPILNGLDAVQQLRRQGCNAKVVLVTMHKDALYAVRALRVGVNGFVLKHATITELLSALNTVQAGGTYVTPEIAQLIENMPVAALTGSDETVLLTPRQREVLQLIAEGFSAKDIAKILHISTRTAENHKAQIMTALAVSSTADLVRCAIRHGLIAAC
jgi:DNA-binding NarL/FixJ family response regulator